MTNVFRLGELCLLAIFLLFSTKLSGQVAPFSTAIGSGGQAALNTVMHISATLGQPIIGTSFDLRQYMWQGFWVGITSPKTSTSTTVARSMSATSVALQCFPNPVSKSMTVSLKFTGQQQVSLTLHDALCREVRSLIDNENQSGDGMFSFDVEEISSGWYTLILSAGNDQAILPVHIVQ